MRRLKLRRLFLEELCAVEAAWHRFAKRLGPWKARFRWAAERFVDCGDREKGHAVYHCGDCGHDIRVPFSCKSRLCPSCVRKRMTQWSEWLAGEVLLDVPHRHWVFTLPLEVRRHFLHKRWLLNMLSSTAARLLMKQLSLRCPEAGAMPGVIAVVQTAG
ncbi:MAG: transposase zinc-binding domain-containing protein, partial [Elusimicrobiota bacterium]